MAQFYDSSADTHLNYRLNGAIVKQLLAGEAIGRGRLVRIGHASGTLEVLLADAATDTAHGVALQTVADGGQVNVLLYGFAIVKANILAAGNPGQALTCTGSVTAGYGTFAARTGTNQIQAILLEQTTAANAIADVLLIP